MWGRCIWVGDGHGVLEGSMFEEAGMGNGHITTLEVVGNTGGGPGRDRPRRVAWRGMASESRVQSAVRSAQIMHEHQAVSRTSNACHDMPSSLSTLVHYSLKQQTPPKQALAPRHAVLRVNRRVAPPPRPIPGHEHPAKEHIDSHGGHGCGCIQGRAISARRDQL